MPEDIRTDGGAVFIPVETYELKVTINTLDYTGDLIMARLRSSLSTGYQVVDLEFSIDPNDVIVEDLYGGANIKMAISLLREDGIEGERIDLDLMMLKGDFILNEKTIQSSEHQKDRGHFSVRAIVRPAYKILNTMVNDVFIGTQLFSVVQTLGMSVGATAVKYDTDGQNTSSIDQVIIPPTTFYKIIKEYDRGNPEKFDGFLDQRFGLFNGTAGVFCQFDKNVYIKNLTTRMSKSPAFVVYQLAIDSNQTTVERIMDDVAKGDTFYTYDAVTTDYSGNAKYASLASNFHHIVKPKDTLFWMIDQTLDDVAKSHSVVYQNPNIDKDKQIERTRYYNEDTGYEKEEGLFNARFGRQLADLSTVSLNIERNLPIFKLLQVGDCVEYKPQTLEYADLSGKYILWSSDIQFSRPNVWETTATINLIRTNKKSGITRKPQYR